MVSEAQKKAVARYDAKNTTKMCLKFNNGTDKDILDHLRKQKSKQGYIKKLIRQDME